MANTPVHDLQYWAQGITQPNVPMNANTGKFDAKLHPYIQSRSTDAQPGSPTEGDVYIITGSATGTPWSTYTANDLAIYTGGAWTAYAPTGAIVAFVADEGTMVMWNGTSWVVLPSGPTQYAGQNLQTGTSYTLLLSDAGKIIEMNNASANTLTIPANSSVAFPVDTRIDVIQYGAGQTTIAINTDTLTGNTNVPARYDKVTLWKRATTEWVVIGASA